MKPHRLSFTIVPMFGVMALAAVGSAGEAPAGVPLVANFDFEAPDAAAAWRTSATKGVPPLVATLDAADPHSGQSALKIQGQSSAEASAHAFTGVPRPVERPQRIRVRFYARGVGIGAKDAELNVLERDSKQVFGWAGGKQAAATIVAAGAWKAYTVDLPLKPETRMLTLMLRLNRPTADKAFWIDDLSIELIDPPARAAAGR